jgi:hypothetical protein
MRRVRRPLYHRLLRLRYLEPGPMATFVLFEGSVMSAMLLSLAEIVDWWSVLALPVTVAAMVKLNDTITGVLRRPDAIAQLSRARLAHGVAIGRSPRPSQTYLTAWIDRDDAEADRPAQPYPAQRPARPAGEGVVRGIAAVPRRDEDRRDGA